MAATYLFLCGQSLRKQRVFRDRINVLDIHDDKSLIERYRLPRDMILDVLRTVEGDISAVTKRSYAVSPLTQLLVTLRFYAKGGFLSETADLHGVSRSSVSRFTNRVTSSIIQHFGGEVSFPPNLDGMKEGFHALDSFPNVVGAIDGTLIPIKAPSVDEYAYVCRKGYHAINVQAICDSNYRFINIVAKWPGAVHDSFILSNSAVANAFETQQIDGWLLGDSGYPLRPWLMTPIANPVNPNEDRYNRSHKKTRNVVERAFGILKSRFSMVSTCTQTSFPATDVINKGESPFKPRCLHKSAGHLMSSPDRCCKIVHACVILHNMCLQRQVPLLDEVAIDDEAPHLYDGPVHDGTTARQALIANRFGTIPN